MTILVTGGAGYVGSHTVRYLQQCGEDVVVYDNLSSGNADAVGSAPLVVGSITDRRSLATVFDDYDITECIHFAALKNVGDSMRNTQAYWDVNVTGSLILVDLLRERGSSNLVFSSSCSVYGTPSSTPVFEDSQTRPESVYAATKLMVEQVLEWENRTGGVSSVSLRYFNAAGASDDNTLGEDWSDSKNLIPVIMKAAFGLSPYVEIFGTNYETPDGTCIRDFVHVEDLAVAHLQALEYLRRISGKGERVSICINLGTGSGTSVMEVINESSQVAGHTIPIKISAKRDGDPESVWADTSRARSILGWSASRNLNQIISSAYNWYDLQNAKENGS